MGKLVRDRIPDIISASGRSANVRMIEGDDLPLALLDKAVEEAVELRDAPPEHRVEEIADILEVLDALQRQLGVAGETVRRVQQAKLEERGGFTEGFWLDS